MIRSHKEFWLGLGSLSLILAAFLALGSRGWPGEADACLTRVPDTCFCEQIDLSGVIRQPINTWSNVGFIAVGLLILWRLGRAPRQIAGSSNPMRTATPYSVGYGLLVVFLGPASMFFHASLRDWGGWLDIQSLILYGSFLCVYDMVRIRNASVGVFLRWYAVFVGPLTLLTWLVKDSGQLVFGGLILGVLIMELVILSTKIGGIRREGRPWLVAGLLSLGIGFFGIWLWSNTTGPFCVPGSWLQGHALWHLLAAASAFFMYLYLRTETNIDRTNS